MSMAVIPAPPEIMPRTKQNEGLLAVWGQFPNTTIEEALTDRLTRTRTIF